MKNSSMYSYLLSKKILLIGLYFGLLYFFYFLYGEKQNFSFMINYISVYIGIIIIIELNFSYLKTFSLLKYVTNEQAKKKVRFYLQILPYAPAIFGTGVVCLFNWFKGTLYPWTVIYMLAGTQLANFISSVVFNTRIGLSEFIDKPEIPTKKKKQPRIKTDSEVSEK